ncbi:DgyrCDS9428 [Dimorphilus gyrociliatus]|uniref:Dihydrolipoamide acetyltransferase component of pyruvate dehydrogenase complex n=1 Tax=Dimorphilus gyrociliatus TaxID=2664684 RepID=A0A7I8VYE1_9ANNE|nr:DgyrCDS9428 [Dimorphilus gyrociliatus]
METGTIVRWLKKEGDAIQAGDAICEIQTDKAVVSFDLEDEGILAKIIKEENAKDIKVGTLIGLVVDEGDDWQNVEIPKDATTEEIKPTAESNQSKKEQTGPQKSNNRNMPIGPAVRLILEAYGLDANNIAGTGHNGMVLKGDVLDYINNKNLKPQSKTEKKNLKPTKKATPVTTPSQTGDYVDIPLTNMRRTIAKRLTESKSSIPHSYAIADCNMTSLLRLRQELKAEGIKVSVNDLIIKATAFALGTVPELNAHYLGDDQGVRVFRSIDISVAVSTAEGLITPIVFNASTLNVKQVSETVNSLAHKARDGKLQLHEFQGGTFTISNLGMFGIDFFSAVINPPQVGILALGGSRKVFQEDETTINSMMSQLSYDNRAVSDDIAQSFMQAFQTAIEKPALLMVEPTSKKVLFA